MGLTLSSSLFHTTVFQSLNMVVKFFCPVKSIGREADRVVSSAVPGAQMMSAKQKNRYAVRDISSPSEALLTVNLLYSPSYSCEDCFPSAAILVSQSSVGNLQKSDVFVAYWTGYFSLQ